MWFSRYGLTRAEQKGKILPRPAGHSAFDVTQDLIGFLGCKHTLPAYVEFFIHIHTWIMCLLQYISLQIEQCLHTYVCTHVNDVINNTVFVQWSKNKALPVSERAPCLGQQENVVSKCPPSLLTPAKPTDWQKSTGFQVAHIPCFAPYTGLSLVQEYFHGIFSLDRTRISVMEKSLVYSCRSIVIPLKNLNLPGLRPGKQQYFCRKVGLLEWCLFSHRSILFTNN